MTTKYALTINQFTEAYGISKASTYRQIKSGQLRAVKCQGRTLIAAVDAQAWLDNLQAIQPKNPA